MRHHFFVAQTLTLILFILTVSVAGCADVYNCPSINAPSVECIPAYGINNNGQEVGNYANSSTPRSVIGDEKAESLSSIDFPGAARTVAFVINNSSGVTRWTSDEILNNAFVDNVGTLGSLNLLEAIFTDILGINDGWQVVGIAFDGTTHWGFVDPVNSINAFSTTTTNAIGRQRVGHYRGGTGEYPFVGNEKNYTARNFPGSTETITNGIKVNAQVVRWYSDEISHDGSVGKAETFSTLNFPGATGTIASGFDDNDHLFGWYSDETANNASIDDETFSAPHVPSPNYSDVLGIDNSWREAGTAFDGTNHWSFVENPGTINVLSFPSTGGLIANGVDDNGKVVGWYSDEMSTDGSVAIAAIFGGPSISSTTGTIVNEINESGQIVRIYDDDLGNTSVATPESQVPEPTSLLLVGSGLMGVAVAVRWKFRH